MNLGLAFLTKNGAGQCAPLGLASIATYLKQNTDVDVKIVDANFENVFETLKRGRFDLIGIGSMTIEYGKAIVLAEKIKNELDVPVIIGGVHISSLPSSFKHCFDAGVVGEGEDTMLELAQLFQRKGAFKNHDLKTIDGLVFFHGDRLVLTNRRKPIGPLDTIPIPDRRFLNQGYFKRRPLNVWGEFGVESGIITSRGCPYRCVFCSVTRFWQGIRFHSVEHVVEEITELVDDYEIDHMQIWDDLFTINKKRLMKIARALRREGLTEKVKFNCQPRANLIDDELCEILKSMNVQIVLFGFESGSERMLKYLKGGSVSVQDNINAIKLCRKHGIKVQGSLIFGSPGETLMDMEKTLEFIDIAKRNGVDHLWSFVMTPFPSTEIWEIAKKRGKVSDDMDWHYLSHQNIEEPLLLDEEIDVNDFKKYFLKGRAKMRYFKWMKALSFLRHSPLEVAQAAFANPMKNLELLLKKHESDMGAS